MRARPVAAGLVAVLVLGGACSDDEASEPEPTLIPEASVTAPGDPGTTSTAVPDQPPPTDVAPTSAALPDVTPPASQPEACALLAAAAGLDVDVELEPADQPSGEPAPSTGCRTPEGIGLALYYGQDPLETLALARVLAPGGTDVTGVGQDAYLAGGTLYVDTGSRAFAVTDEGADQAALEGLARAVIDGL